MSSIKIPTLAHSLMCATQPSGSVSMVWDIWAVTAWFCFHLTVHNIIHTAQHLGSKCQLYNERFEYSLMKYTVSSYNALSFNYLVQ